MIPHFHYSKNFLSPRLSTKLGANVLRFIGKKTIKVFGIKDQVVHHILYTYMYSKWYLSFMKKAV